MHLADAEEACGLCGGRRNNPTKMTIGMENWREDAGDPVYRADCGMSFKSRGRLPYRDYDGVVAVVGA